MSGDDVVFLKELFRRIMLSNTNTVDEDLFCYLVQNNNNLVDECMKLFANEISSKEVKQSLRALSFLEECMAKCGPVFENKFSKYRFLNTLVGLVSEKHKGYETPLEVRNKIMDCFLLWTTQYPHQIKIKEAYDNLCKQGVQHTSSSAKEFTTGLQRYSFMNEEGEKALKKLLQSKDKNDIKKANLLIQLHVKLHAKNEERPNEVKHRLQNIQNTLDVFREVIEKWSDDDVKANQQESVETLNELYSTCQKFQIEISMMLQIIDESDKDLISQAIDLNDYMLKIFEKYNTICSSLSCTNNSAPVKPESQTTNSNVDDLLADFLIESGTASTGGSSNNPLSELTTIFNNTTQEPTSPIFSNLQLLEPTVFAKTSVCQNKKQETNTETAKNEKSFDDIDSISENLLKAELTTPEIIGHFKKTPKKISLNELKKSKGESSNETTHQPIKLTDFDKIINEPSNDLFKAATKDPQHLVSPNITNANAVELLEELKMKPTENGKEAVRMPETSSSKNNSEKGIKFLSQISLKLSDIEASKEKPREIMDFQDVRVVLNFGLNRPSPDVSVLVMTTTNQNACPMNDYKLHASVRKPCKIRLLEPSSKNLPGVKPFQIATEFIHQILLLFNPTKKPVDVTFITEYTLNDDPDPVTDSVLINIPYFN